MSIYAVGDIQGCYDELRALLDIVRFEPDHDQLWLVGDLVNRGPRSLEVLRFVRGLGDAAVAVLGNHDLHLLAMALGGRRERNAKSLNPVLHAPDRDELIDWLRHRPLLHRDKKAGFTMIHAGLPPQWNMKTARSCAREVESVITGDEHREFFKHMYGDLPDIWNPMLRDMARYRFITNCFTRLRFCTHLGHLGLKQKGPPGSQKGKYIPWFEHPHRKTLDKRILFGHWSTLGYHHAYNTWALDSGCLWGGELSALRLNKKKPVLTQLPCSRQQDPGKFT